jgi:hypothetical protein
MLNKQKVEDWLAEKFHWKGHDITVDTTTWDSNVRIYVSYRIHHKTEHGHEMEEGSMMIENEVAKARGWL